mgnify:FL=1
MENRKTITDRIDDLKSVVEGLNVQLHLGKADAEKAFEEQKKNLQDWTAQMSSRIDNAKDLSEENATKIKVALEELQVQAALGKATSKDLLKEQQREIKRLLERLRSDVDLVFGTSREQSSEFLEDLSLRLHDYQVKFDIFKLQLHLAKAESELEFEKQKKEAVIRLKELEIQIEKRKIEASEKWEHFSDEMTTAWKHVRKAFD